MTNELIIVNAQSLSPQTISEIDRQVDNFIERHKINRCELNRLVFDSTAALTAAEKAAQDMTLQGKLKRFWKRFTGSNARKQDDINANFIQAQYAAQQTLQKLAEQNLLSFELIAAVNNKLNVQMAEVNVELNDICSMLLTFFSDTKQQLEDHDKRLKKLEHSDKLQHWTINIENQTFDGIKYRELDDATKIVCVVRDFLKLTNDGRSVTDFDYLETAMGTLGFKSNFKVSGEKFIRQVSGSSKLYNYLFGNDLQLAEFATEYEPIILELREAKESADRKFFVVKESKTSSEKSVKEFGLNIAFSPAENFLLSRIRDRFFEQTDESSEIGSYDLALELLYNLEQAKYAKEFHDKQETARKLFIDCKIEEALSLLRELEAAGDVQSRYILALIYNEGINIEENTDCARELLAANVSANDACSIIYEAMSAHLLSDNSKGFNCKQIVPPTNVFEHCELARILDDEEALAELKQACEDGYFLAAHEIGRRCYFSENVNEDNETARKYFELSAAQGYGKSMFYLGEIYWKGFGVPVDKEKAVEFFKKAYDKHAYKKEYLGIIGNFYDDKENYSEALKWYERAAEKGETTCLFITGYFYHNGRGASKNYAKAVEYFKRAVEIGYSTDGNVEDHLGDIYWEGGNGVTADRSQAVEWYKKAYDKGTISDGLLVRIGKYYDDKKDYSEALKWWRLGAKKEYPTCLYLVGCSYMLSEGVDKNYSSAAKCFKRAIDAGFSNEGKVEGMLGDIYWDGGYETSADKNQAVEWYKKAYAKGESTDTSIGRIADFYMNTDFGFAEAVKWWRRGAEKNYTKSLILLAKVYRNGVRGDSVKIEKDYKKAVNYCERAVKSAEANGYSKSEITKICNEIRERGFFESFFD